MDIEMFGKLSDAFGPSGFEEDVIRTIADYCKEFDVENDAMNNLYVRMPGTEKDSRPVIQLDAHLDACGFMVQNIQDNGCLGIIMLGGFHLTRDNGQGVPADERDKIFETFYRGDKARTGHKNGSGLGLAITKQITDRHGASIRADESELGGLKVIIDLPQAK